MKTIMLLLTGLSLSIVLHAQPGDYNGPARITLISFWEGVAKLEKSISNGGSALDKDVLAGLSRKIGDVKAKDPSYNLSSMQEKVKSLGEKLGLIASGIKQAETTGKTNAMNSQKVGQLLFALFETSIDVSTYDLPTIPEKIAAYKQKMEELLKLDMSLNKNDLEKQFRHAKGSAKWAEKELTGLDARIRESPNPDYSAAEYYELIFNQAYWDAAQKVYPQEESFKTAYLLAGKLIAGLGSLEAVRTMAAASKEQKIKNTVLPKAAVADPVLEKTFVATFNKYHGEEFKATAFKAVITSDDWSVERNDITGIVTGRLRRAAIVYKNKDGKCMLVESYFIRQEYVGNSYTGSYISPFQVMGSREMLCANVK